MFDPSSIFAFELPANWSAPLLFAQQTLEEAATAVTSDGDGAETGAVTRALMFAAAAVVALVVPYLAGLWVGKTLRMPSHGWKIGVIFCSIVCGILICTFGTVRLGVDLRGGANLVFAVKPAEAAEGVVRSEGGISADEMAALVEVLGRRINPSGTREIVIRGAGNDQVEVIVPEVGEQEIDEVVKQLTTAGFLQFRIVANERDHGPMIESAMEQLDSKFVYENPDDKDSPAIGMWARVGRGAKEDEATVRVKIDNKEVSRKIRPLKYPAYQDIFRDAVTHEVIQIPPGVDLSDKDDRRPEHKFEKWLMENGHYNRETGFNDVEVLMSTDDGYNVRGDDLSFVRSSYDDLAQPMISFNMTSRGAIKMGGLTGDNLPEDTGFTRKLGILLDNELLSAPSIRGHISDRGQITGNFTQAEVDFLVGVLRAGRLPAILEEEPVSRDIIDSQLGRDMIDSGMWAIGGSLIAVLVFMLIYYRFSGVVACVALILNLLLIVAAMILVKAPFTLPGLAGIVLTVGMAVDANVLIYERMREEIARGAAMRMVIRNGFDRATTTIIDSNLTTVISAVVLYVVGTDQLRGFSVALILGLIISMFTAIFCGRVIFDIAERKWGLTTLKMLKIIGHTNFDFMKVRWMTASVSIAIIVVGLVATFIRGKEILDIDMKGGASVGLVLKDNSMDTNEVRDLLATELKDERKVDFTLARVQSGDETSQPVWTLDTSFDSEESLAEAMKEIFGDKLAMHSFNYKPLAPADVAGGTSAGNRAGASEGGAQDDNAPEATGETPSATDGAAFLRSREGQYFVAQLDEENADAVPDTETGEATVAEPAADSPPSGEAESTETPEETDASDATAPAETPEAETESTTEPAPETTSAPAATSPAETTPSAPAKPARTRYATVVSFGHPIDRDSLEAAIEETIAANKLRFSLSDVDLRTVEASTSENPIGKDWNLTIAADEQEIVSLLDTLKRRYDSEPYFRGLRVVKSQVAGGKRAMALWALIASFAGIVAYIWVRFQKVSFGLAAVIALVHDVLVTLAAIAVSYWLASALGFLMVDQFKISLAVVAAFLTIIGFSINDTIVIFDRIREIRGKSPDINAAMINAAVNQTLARSILTSLTVLMVVLILYFFGGAAIHGFAFAMVVGVIAGSYSTIFIASPVLLWLANLSRSRDRQAQPREKYQSQEDKSLTA